MSINRGLFEGIICDYETKYRNYKEKKFNDGTLTIYIDCENNEVMNSDFVEKVGDASNKHCGKLAVTLANPDSTAFLNDFMDENNLQNLNGLTGAPIEFCCFNMETETGVPIKDRYMIPSLSIKGVDASPYIDFSEHAKFLIENQDNPESSGNCKL